MFGPTPGTWGRGGPGRGGNKVDLADKPRLWEAYLGLGAVLSSPPPPPPPSSAAAALKEKESLDEHSSSHPLAAGNGNGTGNSGSSSGGGGYGVDWEGIMPFSAALTSPLPTSLSSSSTSANHAGGGSGSNGVNNNSNAHVNSNENDNDNANRSMVQRIGRSVVDAPRTAWGLISAQPSLLIRGRNQHGAENGNGSIPMTTATTGVQGQSGVGRFLRRSPRSTNDVNNTANAAAVPNANNSPPNSNSNTSPTNPNKAKDASSSNPLHQALPSGPTTSPLGVRVSVLIAMPSQVPLYERLHKVSASGENEEEEELPYLEMGVCEVVMPPEVDGNASEGSDLAGKGKECVESNEDDDEDWDKRTVYY
ncbi:hypothetical protein K435DRAFT_792350 [Dendrothele bispora CBS 962.96]|uniref:Uncharacterized protein n=1 Tax=Dendrothele bispora (strain CBS 962.96) TaxID=1314807 RepID=A0A4S8MJ04_DENBC|nr:hypothetical protein K435DRAFT_792350 [Dendrothele bispora CBS 962.96]